MLEQFAEGLAAAMGTGYYVLVYGMGILAMVLSVIAYQFQYRVTILLCNFFGQTCWVAYFLLQGDGMSAVTCAISAVMLAVFAKKDKWKWATGLPVILLFIVVFSAVSLISFRTWSDVFPLLAGIFAVVANSRATEKRLRQFSVLWCLSWLLNSVVKGYPVAFANDLFCTVSAIVSLIRYREKK